MIVVDKRGENRGIDAVEDEGQWTDTDNDYQPAAANVTGEESDSKEVKIIHLSASVHLLLSVSLKMHHV